jgi:hypothetical protein
MTLKITKIINEEKMMLEAAALISSCYAPWAHNYYMVAKPSQMTCLPSSLPSTSRIITKGSGRLCLPACRVHFWNLSEHLVLLALADEYTELELKSKILVKLLDSEVPGPFKIGKPLLVLSDLVVHRAAPFESGRCSQSGCGEVEQRRSLTVLLTLSSTL